MISKAVNFDRHPSKRRFRSPLQIISDWRSWYLHEKMKMPDATTMKDWKEWKEEWQAKKPIMYWLLEEFPFYLKIPYYRYRDIRWWFLVRFHPKYINHIIPTGLKPGYYGLDERLLRGTFFMLDEFVKCLGGLEKFRAEMDFQIEHLDPVAGKRAIDEYEEAKAIANWWYLERPRREAEHDEKMDRWHDRHRGAIFDEDTSAVDPEGEDIMSLHKEETENFYEDSRMIGRLAMVRHLLWD